MVVDDSLEDLRSHCTLSTLVNPRATPLTPACATLETHGTLQAFRLHAGEETLYRSVVPAAPRADHAALDAVVGQQALTHPGSNVERRRLSRAPPCRLAWRLRPCRAIEPTRGVLLFEDLGGGACNSRALGQLRVLRLC